MSEPSAAITGSTPKETGTEISSFVPTASRGLMSVPPHPIFQPRIVLDTAREDLRQHLPSTSDVLPQILGEYTASFDQPVPVPELAADNPYSVVPQPVKSFPTPPQLEDAVYQLSPRKLADPRKGRRRGPDEIRASAPASRLRRSNRAVATTRNDRDDHTAISRQDLDLPCPLSALTNGMQHIPVRDMYAWVHRPVETRRQEARQRQGRIPRPPNPFILYLLAYSDREKHWLAQNDHRAIFILTGRS
ncbi:hypothetical protein AtubIFM55763_011742 [Aspergillus tubingensis]|nr:hypothetical protein AtubIFM55763_011742 [Aspergillus tubingensis]